MIIVKIQGGLGNQLFQYATGRAISLMTGFELKLDISFYEEERFKGVYRLDRYKIECKIAEKKEIDKLKGYYFPNITKFMLPRRFGVNRLTKKRSYVIERMTTESDKQIFRINKPSYIEGWLAKFKYFVDFSEILHDDLTLRDYSSLNDDLIREINSSHSVSIHIRRGEYLVNPYFHNLSIIYYTTAMEQLNCRFNNLVYYVFSDDIGWAKENLPKDGNIQFIEENSVVKSYYNTDKDYLDLYLMSLCKHNIIANSTFSWWGAWLNKNPEKVIIVPKKWFDNKEAQRKYEISKSFIPETWIKI